ncbi:MAG TPA: hypothetical protein VGN32_05855 [Ktedonobacterales bacterium]|jgi:hypothetical protein|nr:hypothetical protein [Ktedonobacterales bacterium]
MAQTDIPEHFADQRLVGVLVRHQGAVTARQLKAAGYSAGELRHLLADRVLVPTDASDDTVYGFPDPAVYIDMLVLVQWRLPEGIFGGRTALVFYDLTVTLPKGFDVCVPSALTDRERAVLPENLGVRPFTLPEALRTYGVTRVYPAQPGDVPVAMYTPSVAVAQTLADEYYMEETREDCVNTYVQDYGLDTALLEAAERYSVSERLQTLLPHWE